MENNQIVIPDGWTYYTHRTNTERWSNNPFEEDIIVVNKLMSVVTESEIYQELNHYGKNHLQGYSTGKGEPFEIRCLICNLGYLQTFDKANKLKDIMLKEFYYDRRNFGGCYGQRHHSIPKDEELIVIGIGNYDEVFGKDKKIIWTIPRRFLEFYKEEIKKGNNRIIEINKEEVKKR